jgi:hypothetical protein
MAEKQNRRRTVLNIVVLVCLIALVYIGRVYYHGAKTMHELLSENKHLKKAITNLTLEDQIGYAKVISQEHREGKFYTTIKFVETARDDKLSKVLEKDYIIEGDIIHFDALIVKFGDKMVMDGQEKSLYLWRRVYSENIAPENGLSIEETGTEPQRYSNLLGLLPANERDLFWSNIWELANNPDMLQEYDIKAIYGNVVYSKLQKGRIYFFKINSAGQLYPETVIDI